MKISSDAVKELRASTGCGMVDCQKALHETKGDVEKAVLWLRQKGKATAAKKSQRATHEGVIAAYVHTNQKIAVLVSLLCESDFVARNEKFQQLAKNIALHIAATDPLAVKPEDISAELIDKETSIAKEQAASSGKPAAIQDKIVSGKITTFKKEHALLTQAYVREPQKTIQDIINEAIAELGENISVAKFARLTIE